jgi:hypothetical protein
MEHNFIDEDKLCRVLYHDFDVDSRGVFTKASVMKRDLTDEVSGLSVDLKSLICVEELTSRIMKQQLATKEKQPEKREKVFIATFFVSKLLDIVDDDDEERMFEVFYSPVVKDGVTINPAHCHIRCCKRDKEKQYYNEARAKIQELFQDMEHLTVFLRKCFNYTFSSE